MLQKSKICLYVGMLLVLAFFSVSGASAAPQFLLTNASAPDASGGPVTFYLVCNDTEQLEGYAIRIKWDPSVMNITNAVNVISSDTTAFSATPRPSNTGQMILIWAYDAGGLTPYPPADDALVRFTAYPKAFNGSATTVYFDPDYVSREISETGKGNVYNTYGKINGTFTTFDAVSPEITITTPADGATVPQTVNVAATITDAGGVNATSVEVSIGGVDVVPTLVPIVNGYSLTAQRADVPIGTNVQVSVSAEDLTGNYAFRAHYVTVAQAGITFASPANGTYTNETQPVIRADFVQVNSGTVKMFINNVDVTASCDVTGTATEGAISLNYGSYGALVDDAYCVVVNGTSALVAQEESDHIDFVKDTAAPIVTITNIVDHDGDGVPESGELLYVYYTAVDANLDDVWFCDAYNTSRLSQGRIDLNITTGNKERAAYARDLAGNVNNSAPVHIYNNNLAYFDDPTLGSFAGLDLTKTALYNIFDTAKSIVLTGSNAKMTLPTLGQLDKGITGGSNVTLDYRKDDPIQEGTLPGSIMVYPTPSGSLDLAVQIPRVDNATMMIAKANSTLLEQLSFNPSGSSMTPGTLQELLSKDKVVIFSKSGATPGYAIVRIKDDSTMSIVKQVGGISIDTGSMENTIKNSYFDVNQGFDTSLLGLTINVADLGPGSYISIATCIDNGRFAILATTPFEIPEEGPGILSTSAASYNRGHPVVVNSQMEGDTLSAFVINSASTYTGNVTLNFSTLGSGSFESAYLLADGNQTVEKLTERANLWITKGYGTGGAQRNATSVNVPTDSLLPGTYRVCMILENGGNVTAYREATVTVTMPPLPVAGFTTNVTTGYVPLAVQFTDASTGDILSRTWAFGCGDTSTETNPVHTYTAAGNYTVNLTVRNAAGESTVSKNITVLAPAAPVAAFTATPTTGQAPLAVQFTDESSGIATAWFWEFGCGDTSTLQNPSHTYTVAGTYSVNLTVTNQFGSNSTLKTNYITVSAAPSPSGGRGGGGSGSRSTSVPVFDQTGTLTISKSGVVTKTIKVEASDKVAALTIPQGVTALDASGNPLTQITVDPITGSGVPDLPSGAEFSFAGYAYSCGPDGATFSPGIGLAFTFTEEEWNAIIAEGRELVIKWYNKETGVWEEIPTTVNAATRTVSASITHFSVYALFSTEAITVTPTVTVTPTQTVPPTTPVTPPAEEMPFMVIIIAIIAIIVVAGVAFLYMEKNKP